VRAPVCEVSVGALWGITGGLWGAGRLPQAWLPAVLGLAWLGVAAGLVDLRHRRLPNTLTAAAAVLGPLSLLLLGPGAVGRGLLGGLVAVVGYGLVHALRPAALGLGDVKLAGPLGAVLGAASWSALVVAAALAAVFTGVAGVFVLSAGRGPPRAAVVGAVAAGAVAADAVVPDAVVPEVGVSEAATHYAAVPHGPSMLAAAWLVTLATAAGGS
jgi:leader peptidase (prepilin peptidase) / N-methyltransferase